MEITDNSLIFQVDKEVLLKTLAEKAQSAGADIYFNMSMEELLHTDQIIGVKVKGTPVGSLLVISVEGLSRKFTNEVGLYTESPSAYFFMVGTYVDTQ